MEKIRKQKEQEEKFEEKRKNLEEKIKEIQRNYEIKQIKNEEKKKN